MAWTAWSRSTGGVHLLDRVVELVEVEAEVPRVLVEFLLAVSVGQTDGVGAGGHVVDACVGSSGSSCCCRVELHLGRMIKGLLIEGVAEGVGAVEIQPAVIVIDGMARLAGGGSGAVGRIAVVVVILGKHDVFDVEIRVVVVEGLLFVAAIRLEHEEGDHDDDDSHGNDHRKTDGQRVRRVRSGHAHLAVARALVRGRRSLEQLEKHRHDSKAFYPLLFSSVAATKLVLKRRPVLEDGLETKTGEPERA